MARLDIEAHIVIDEATLEAAEDKLLEMCDVPGVKCLSWRQVGYIPKVIELGEILTTSGAGYLEDHYLTDDGELRQTLASCAWLHGFVMEDDGCQIERSYLSKNYGKARGLRIWDRKPTDEQRKAVPWDATCHEYLDWCKIHGEELERRKEYNAGMGVFWDSVRMQFEQERRGKRRSRRRRKKER